MKKQRVIIESPLRGDYEKNTRYARALMRDSLQRGEAPFCSHVLYPIVLDDRVEDEREMGMTAGFAWGSAADFCVVGMDLGISPGMQRGIAQWMQQGMSIEYRLLGADWDIGPTVSVDTRTTCSGCCKLKVAYTDDWHALCTAKGETISPRWHPGLPSPGWCPGRKLRGVAE